MDKDDKIKVEDETTAIIEMILNKESWTGRDLGFLAIANAATRFQQTIQKKETKTPLIDNKRLQNMVDTLSWNDKEIQIYKNYTTMYSWIMKRCQIAGLKILKAKNECQHLSSIILEAIMVEDAIKCANSSAKITNNIRKIFAEYSIDNIKTNRIDDIVSSKSNLIKDLYYVNGVNNIIDMIVKAYKLPPFLLFKVPMEDICDKIDELKKKILTLKNRFSNATYVDEKHKNENICFISKFFGDIEYKTLKPSRENKDIAYKSIKDFSVFTSSQKTKNIVSLVCELP